MHRILEKMSNVRRAFMFCHKCHINAGQFNTSFIGEESAANGIEEGRLSGTIGTDNRDEITGFYMQGKVIQCRFGIRCTGIECF